ncbi:MAG: hypothetical protein ABWX85_07285 [Arthrobacter sp.]
MTSILSAPGMVPSAGATDWAIHSSGSSKRTCFAGSLKTFHAAPVEPGFAGPVDPGEAAGVVLPADGSAKDVAFPPWALPAVQAGAAFPSALQPDSATTASATAAAAKMPRPDARRKNVSLPVMVPA